MSLESSSLRLTGQEGKMLDEKGLEGNSVVILMDVFLGLAEIDVDLLQSQKLV